MHEGRRSLYAGRQNPNSPKSYIYIYISRYIHLSIHILPYLFSTLSMCLEQNLRHRPLTLCLLTHHFTYHSFRYISIYLYSLTIDHLVQFTHTFFFYISLYRYITLEVHTQHIPLSYQSYYITFILTNIPTL